MAIYVVNLNNCLNTRQNCINNSFSEQNLVNNTTTSEADTHQEKRVRRAKESKNIKFYWL